ncbi:MAG: SOSS complex subunit B family protein [Nanoarchaeota archaeon]
MEVKDLQSGQGKVDIELGVKSKDNIRTFNKYGKDLRVCNAVVFDSSGEITLTLWNDDIDKINVGDKIRIINGYVSEFNGVKQLTPGKFGKMEVVDGKADSHANSKKAKVVEEEVAF